MDKIEKKNLIAGLYGNAVEWYDFLLYASFAPVFAVIFFPTDNKILSLIATFTLFAVSFLMRPLGGILFGHLGDSWGRRKALIACLTLMTIATICIAITPTFLQLGIIATLLFSFFSTFARYSCRRRVTRFCNLFDRTYFSKKIEA